MLSLNDKYALDPNSYANILRRIALRHRPWGARPIFGMPLHMARNGMNRRTDAQVYRNEIDCLERTGKELTT